MKNIPFPIDFIGIMISKIPQKLIYAIMAVLELTLHHGSFPLQAKVIARRQGIPLRFIEHVLHALKRAGLIQSLRGAQGGYMLNRDPQQLSLADVVEAMRNTPIQLQPPLPSNGHYNDGPGRRTNHEALLATVWKRISAAEVEILGSITLETLAEQHRQREQERAPMYHI
ncbi:MAG: Rrf2 family transcriptional regulator [Nitrospirales bacterium]|nr:Rrf2 family transcriptional regulator [Nitrospirales bacterium]